MRKLRFARAARDQFHNALRFIGADKPSAAVSFRKKAEQSLDRLKQFPESGRRIPEFENMRYREVVVAPYRFFYRIEGDVVLIVGVWHAAQLPQEPK